MSLFIVGLAALTLVAALSVGVLFSGHIPVIRELTGAAPFGRTPNYTAGADRVLSAMANEGER